jgi:hypothetical protein
MTKEEANRINAVMKNVTNIKTLLAELLMPINALQQKYSVNAKEAVNIKMKAEDYLKKYGVFTLDTTVKTINTITKNIGENKQEQVKIIQTHWT